ncbi:hypothetical protein OU792_14475 [Algoriphagus sp. NF]|jgi:predicted RNA binding protein YcfA (HicA-like mRNA interferase family)|uniref:type II toxin-antitoxin system HicA family toxin n=1 Tax=Algoriphagus sp. NF TaxID=2992756 RepID=UPI001066C158|nr:type II toxin-antitoxin system HicA family toxin [Algoriphagus sp. NF]MDE0561203.1 hypothetical protein [Algoriphagus sp. NF]
MGKYEKLIAKILSGSSDNNISFLELRNLILIFGFSERIKGSHHIFSKDDVEEILNLQEKNSKAKPYQVKQVRLIILKYQLSVKKSED